MQEARTEVAIEIEGLQLFGHHGWLPEERRVGQPFTVDLRLELKDKIAPDELEATVDYTQVIMAIRELNEQKRFKLLECLAQEIAELVLARFPTVAGVRVRVRKPRPPLPPGVVLDGVTAEARLIRTSD